MVVRNIIAALLIATIPQALYAHWVGRICSNPNCVMCMGLHLQAGHNISAEQLNNTYDWFELHRKLHKIENQATPQEVVDKILEIISPKPDDVLYDLGCGDGRFVITAAKKYKCKAVGIEIDKSIATIAYKNVKHACVSKLARIYYGDARTAKIDDATIIVMYLFPDTIKQLEPKIFNARMVVSYSHDIPGVETRKVTVRAGGKQYPVYIWERKFGKAPWSLINNKWSLTGNK